MSRITKYEYIKNSCISNVMEFITNHKNLNSDFLNSFHDSCIKRNNISLNVILCIISSIILFDCLSVNLYNNTLMDI